MFVAFVWEVEDQTGRSAGSVNRSQEAGGPDPLPAAEGNGCKPSHGVDEKGDILNSCRRCQCLSVQPLGIVVMVVPQGYLSEPQQRFVDVLVIVEHSARRQDLVIQ